MILRVILEFVLHQKDAVFYWWLRKAPTIQNLCMFNNIYVLGFGSMYKCLDLGLTLSYYSHVNCLLHIKFRKYHPNRYSVFIFSLAKEGLVFFI